MGLKHLQKVVWCTLRLQSTRAGVSGGTRYMNTVDLDENVNVSRDGAGITSGAHCRPFRYAIFACGAIAAAQAMAQATRDEAHRACDHLVGYDDCFGACVEWHMSSSPWSDDDLIRRGEECMTKT